MRLLDGLLEIDFGRWEGLTADEIRAQDPIRYEDWQQGRQGFEYPGGERRADFQARVDRAVDTMFDSGMSSILVVVHKGVIRAIVRKVAGEELSEGVPKLGGMVQLTRSVADEWFVGRHGNPATS